MSSVFRTIALSGAVLFLSQNTILSAAFAQASQTPMQMQMPQAPAATATPYPAGNPGYAPMTLPGQAPPPPPPLPQQNRATANPPDMFQPAALPPGPMPASSEGTPSLPAHAMAPPPAPPPSIAAGTAAQGPDSVVLPEPSKASTKASAAKRVSHSTRALKKHRSAKRRSAKKDSGNPIVRDAQTHLSSLGYYKTKIDGLMGPKTRAAIKQFQREHKLRANGVLTQPTITALLAADREKIASSSPVMVNVPPPPSGPPEFYTKNPDFYGHYNQAYENPVMMTSPQSLFTRYGKLELIEDITPEPPIKRYKVQYNGLPMILIDNQPSVIGVSKTYQLGDEDVIIFTSYRDDAPTCAYAYHLLVLTAGNTKSFELKDCTRGYQAKEANGSLFITFPQSDDQRDIGATWRYEKGSVQKL